MISCSRKRKRERVKVGDDDAELKLVSDFLKEAADEGILFEIFVRHSNCRSAILFGSVCHHWHSLISQPQFIPRFISHHHEHQNRYPPPYTIIFRKADKKGPFKGPQYFQPICKLFSEESMFLHGLTTSSARFSTNYLEDFLPSPMVIRASCNDLLLVSPDKCDCYPGADLYICNPITKQFYQLPKLRRTGQHSVVGHALVCMNTNENNTFKVVEIHYPTYCTRPNSKKPASISTRIFSSESGKWEIKCFQYRRPKRLFANFMLDVVTCNGIAYWLESQRGVERVLALDLLNSHCGVIVFPNDFWWFRQRKTLKSDVRPQIGIVCGELRLLQVVLTYKAGVELISSVSLKVWKLKNHDDHNRERRSWVLVHNKKKLKRPCNEEQFVAPFVHPTNGDVVFMVWGKNIFQNNLMMEDSCKMIDELQEPMEESVRGWYQSDRLMSFPMVHPAWPTLLPSA